MLEKLPEALGHALRHQRAGLDGIAFRLIDLRQGMGRIEVRSSAFVDHAPLPVECTADGAGVSPPLQWSGLPEATASVVVMVEDADAPTPHPLVHALVVDLPRGEQELREGALKSPGHEGDDGVKTGRNSYLQTGWLPPDPPPGHGVHRYAFEVFALAEGPAFGGTPGREAVLDALRERAVASGCLIGTYERPDGSIKEGAAEPVAAAGLPLAGA
jgi:Raf kinase inhibitor-like YbhB/YbcL family protein